MSSAADTCERSPMTGRTSQAVLSLTSLSVDRIGRGTAWKLGLRSPPVVLGYLIAPAVMPPTKYFSIKAKRMTAGTIAMREAANICDQFC